MWLRKTRLRLWHGVALATMNHYERFLTSFFWKCKGCEDKGNVMRELLWRISYHAMTVVVPTLGVVFTMNSFLIEFCDRLSCIERVICVRSQHDSRHNLAQLTFRTWKPLRSVFRVGYKRGQTYYSMHKYLQTVFTFVQNPTRPDRKSHLHMFVHCIRLCPNPAWAVISLLQTLIRCIHIYLYSGSAIPSHCQPSRYCTPAQWQSEPATTSHSEIPAPYKSVVRYPDPVPLPRI